MIKIIDLPRFSHIIIDFLYGANTEYERKQLFNRISSLTSAKYMKKQLFVGINNKTLFMT